MGIKFASNISFENCVKFFCENASQKLHTSAKAVSYLYLDKLKCLMKPFNVSVQSLSIRKFV